MSNQAGKGSKPRPVNKEKYDENFDDIQWKGIPEPKPTSVKKGKATYKY